MAVALDTDNTYKLTKNVSKSGNYNSVSIQFGDGYRQTTIDGINYDREQWSLQFIPMDSTSALALESILLNSINGTSNFLSWTPPNESTTKYWSASGITKNSTQKVNYWQISCTLTREFPIIV